MLCNLLWNMEIISNKYLLETVLREWFFMWMTIITMLSMNEATRMTMRMIMTMIRVARCLMSASIGSGGLSLVTPGPRLRPRLRLSPLWSLIMNSELDIICPTQVASDINNGDPVSALATVPLTTGDFLLTSDYISAPAPAKTQQAVLNWHSQVRWEERKN